MSEDTSNAANNQDGKPSGAGGDTPATTTAFSPITSQADLDKLIGARIDRERAKFADYAALQEKAKKLDDIELANKSELEKAADARAKAEQDAAAAKADALRWRIAAKFGLSDEDAELYLTGPDEATLTRQAEGLRDRIADKNRPRAPRPDPTQGRPSSSGVTTDPAQEFANFVRARNP